MSILMILNDIRMSDTQLPETDHTPYCPGRDIGSRFGSGFIIERSKELQVASRVKARGKGRKGSRDHAGGSRGKGRKGSRDHAGGSRERSKGKKGSCDHADGSHARSHASGKGRKGNGHGDRARGGALAHAHTRACTRACARTRTRGARQYEVLRLQHLQKPLAA
jgi:hypothetical protein